MKMLHNILKFEKSMTLTHNFDQLDTELIGSEQIQKFIQQHPDRYSNPSNIAKMPNINISFNNVVSLESNLKYWVYVWSFGEDYSFDINLTDNGNNSGGGNVEMNRNRDVNDDSNEYDNGFPHLILKRQTSAQVGGSGDNDEMGAILTFF